MKRLFDFILPIFTLIAVSVILAGCFPVIRITPFPEQVEETADIQTTDLHEPEETAEPATPTVVSTPPLDPSGRSESPGP